MSEWDNGDDSGMNGEGDDKQRHKFGIAGLINPHDPGWKDNLQDAVQYAWDKHHQKGAGEAVYKADIYVSGNNPISGYFVVLTP